MFVKYVQQRNGTWRVLVTQWPYPFATNWRANWFCNECVWMVPE